MSLGVELALSLLPLRSEQFPAVAFLSGTLAQILISLNLVATLPKVVELLRELNRIDFQIRAELFAAGFSQFVACHWLTVLLEDFQALHLASSYGALDSLGGFVRCDRV